MSRWTFTLRDRSRGRVVVAECLSDPEGNCTDIRLVPQLPADIDAWLEQLSNRPLDLFRDAEKLTMGCAGDDGPLWFFDSDGRIVLIIPPRFTVAGPPRLAVTMEDDEKGVAAVRLQRAD